MYYPRLLRAFVLSLILALVPLAAWGQKAACTTSGTINTTSGPICGLAPTPGGPAVSSYLGIPYAQAQRWQNPQRPQRWTATFSATQMGNVCPQPPMTNFTSFTCPLAGQSEDCLNLNVWVPQGASSSGPLPVMVFFYGGAFLTGSGEQAIDNGANLAAAGDVIVVTFNYRLGALGFLVQSASNISGNLGFLDQIAALQWVKDNIGAFGGDPTNITIFGESAGAMSVGLHALSSTQSSTFFKAAIMESNPLGLAFMTPSQASGVGSSLVSALDCSGYSSQQDCLQNIDACKIVAAESQVTISFLKQGNAALPFAPVIDGVLLTQQPVAAAEAGKLQVPMILGTNQNEGTLFAALAFLLSEVQPGDYNQFLANLVGPGNVNSVQGNPEYKCTDSSNCTLQMAEVITDYVFACANRHLAGTAPGSTYAYEFSESTSGCSLWPLVPACDLLVCHGAELPYVFNTPGALRPVPLNPKCSFGPNEAKLSNAIQSYWTSFARSQSPSGPAPWPPLQNAKNYMMLSLPIGGGSLKTAADPWSASANCAFWDDIRYQHSAAWDRFLESLRSGR